MPRLGRRPAGGIAVVATVVGAAFPYAEPALPTANLARMMASLASLELHRPSRNEAEPAVHAVLGRPRSATAAGDLAAVAAQLLAACGQPPAHLSRSPWSTAASVPAAVVIHFPDDDEEEDEEDDPGDVTPLDFRSDMNALISFSLLKLFSGDPRKNVHMGATWNSVSVRQPQALVRRIEVLVREALEENVATELVPMRYVHGYCLWMLAGVQLAYLRGQPVVARLNTLSAIMALEQYCLDGNWQMAWELADQNAMPFGDEPVQYVDARRGERFHPFLEQPVWVAAFFRRVKG